MNYPHTHILIPYTKDRRPRVLTTLDSIQQNTDIEVNPHSVHLYENSYIGFPSAILNMVENINGYVFLGASDLLFSTDWLSILWKKFEEVGRKGAIEPYNEIQKGKLCQHPLIHSDLVKKYFNRHYFHCYCDNEMHTRLLIESLYTYCPESRIEHCHVVNKKAPLDASYEVTMNRERLLKDYFTFIRRNQEGFKD